MYKIVVFFLFTSFGIKAQKKDFNSFYQDVEKSIFDHNLSNTLKELNSVLGNKSTPFTPRELEILKVLKAETLTEAALNDEAIVISNEVVKNNIVPNEFKARNYITRALIYEIFGDFKKCFSDLQAAKKIITSNEIIKKKYYAKWLLRLASWHRMQGSKRKYFDIAVKAKNYADSTNNIIMSAEALNLMSIYYNANNNPRKALEIVKNSILVNKRDKNIMMTARLYSNASHYCNELGLETERKKYLDSSVNIIKNTPYLNVKTDLFAEKGAYFEEKKVNDSALYYVRLSAEFEKEYNFEQKKKKLDEIELQKTKSQNEIIQQKNQRQLTYIISLITFSSLLIIGFYFIIKNRTKIKNQKKQLEENNELLIKASQEKDFYVQELNHRVKNNLSVILGLIDMQENGTENNKKILAVLHDRVNTIALGHQLYSYNSNSTEASHINLKEYLQNIFQTKSYATSRKLSYSLNVEEIKLNMDKALPLGLILNELITNSIKHAETKSDCELQLNLNVYLKNNIINIIYSDNGQVFEPKTNSNSLGLYIIDGMINQLFGNYTRGKSTYSITMPYDKQ